MGVPGFFKWLLDNKKKNKNINLIKESLDIKKKDNTKNEIKYLMLDTNCLLHPCVNYIKEKYINNKLKLDKTKKIRPQIEKYIWNIIEKRINDMIEIINPEIIYIAIDGVAPMAKILQQRQRRHRYLYDSIIKFNDKKDITIDNNKQKEEIEEILTDGIEVPIFPISSIELTPGTDYMERIHINMINYINKLKIKNIYSSYHTEGEGEHKILKYIKNVVNKGEKVIIYGLDADLLFLALSAGEEHDIYIMREKPFFTNKEFDMEEKVDYNYVEIKELHIIINNLGIPTNDFILLCYMIGNDFIPSLLTLDIKKHGLDKIINAYEETRNKLNLKTFKLVDKDENNKIIINYDILFEIFNILKYTEIYIWNNINRKKDYIDNQKKIYNNSNHENNVEKIDKIDKDNLEYSKKLDKFISGESFYTDCFDKIEFNNSLEYYNYYLGTNEIQTNKTTIERLVDNYLEGFEWYIKYYLDECISWKWGYNYMVAPLIIDIINNFPSKNEDIKSVKHDVRELCPVEQLLLAIPIDTYKYVINKSLIKKMKQNREIGYMFPETFDIDINKESVYWKCMVKIPMVDYDEYIKEIKNIFKNKKEIKNEIQKEIINNRL